MNTRRTDGVTVRPLFYDALSGEFNPPSDEQKRAHTLGRLSYACYQKGNYTEDSRTGLTVIQYVPSWAEHVTVRSRWLENDSGVVLSRLSLVSAEGHLDVYDDVGNNEIAVGNDSSTVSLTLNLGEDLRVARTVVTSTTQAFFELSY